MEIQRIQALLEKYATDELSDKEQEELSNELARLNEHEKENLLSLYTPLWNKAKAGQLPADAPAPDWQQMLQGVTNSDNETSAPPVIPFYKKPWLRYAAVFVLVAAGAYIWMQQRTTIPVPHQVPVSYQQPATIAPGGNKAILTLSNGQHITLDSAINGSLAIQGATQVMKLHDGSIAYKGGTGDNSKTLYNTIAVPKGGQYQLTLNDGTKVWLNALTSLHYPVSFNGKERIVTLEGEAYFEVAHDKSKPFRVIYKNMKVEVLGTRFNIMGYEDELATKTTLLEGSVKVSSAIGNPQSAILKPGEQAIAIARPLTTDHSPFTIHHTPNVEQAIAWKNGYFDFDKADMPTVLRQLARWYDLEIIYKGDGPQDLFSGKIERSLPLQSMLNLFKQSNLNFEVKGRSLIIL